VLSQHLVLFIHSNANLFLAPSASKLLPALTARNVQVCKSAV